MMKKWIASAGLALCLLLVLLPVNAEAAETAGKGYVIYFVNHNSSAIWSYPMTHNDLSLKVYEAAPYKVLSSAKAFVTSYNSQADGSGTAYSLTSEIRNFCSADASKSSEVYAQWETYSGSYGILYIGAGTEGTEDGKDYYLSSASSTTVTLADENIFRVSGGKQIIGWSPVDDPDTKYYPGQTIEIKENLRLIPIIGENWITYHYTHRSSASDTHGTQKEVTEFYTSYYIQDTYLRDFPTVQYGWQLFHGWNQRSDGSGTWYKQLSDIPANVHNVYGISEKYPDTGNGYYILYDELGEGTNAKRVYAIDSTGCVGSLPAPQHDEYTFLGWYDHTGNDWTELKSGDPAIKNWTYRAVWAPVSNAYIITCNPRGSDGKVYYDDGDQTAQPEIYPGNKLVTQTNGTFNTALPQPKPASGWEFLGWFDAPEGGNLITIPMTLNANVTIYGHWTKETCTITFDPRNSTELLTRKTDSSGIVTDWPENPVYSGYDFTGWFTEQQYATSYKVDANTVFLKSQTVYAHWTQHLYTVTFQPNNGKGTYTGGYHLGDKIASESSPTWECHTFLGWFKDEDLNNPWDINADTVKEDITLYAKWEKRHIEDKIPAIPATCTTDGMTAGKKCSVCDEILIPQEPIPALEHNWVRDENATETITKQPTCTEAGEKTITGGSTCSWCGQTSPDEQTVSILPLEHKWGEAVETVTKSPTCKEKGSKTVTRLCTRDNCDAKDETVVELELLAHTWGEWSTTKEPTATEAGEKKRVCSVCGETETAELPATGTTPGGDAEGGNKPGEGDNNPGESDNKPGEDDNKPDDEDSSKPSEGDKPTTPVAPTVTRYRVYTPGSTSGGSFSVSHSSAAQGTRITVTLSPRSDYALDRLLVTNLNTGRSIDLTRQYSDEYTFTMPSSDVEVELSFVNTYNRGTYYYFDVPSRAKPGPTAWYYRDRHIYHVTDGLVPDHTLITRDMLLSVLYNLTDDSLIPVESLGSETNAAQVWATSNGIMPDIYASGLWGLDRTLSREQTAMLVYGYAGYRGCNTSQTASLTNYSDYSRVRPAARTAMSWVLAAGLLDSSSASSLSPQATVTCGQAGELFYRFVTTVAR